MSVDERSRLQLAEALKRALGDDEGITLMELLPPVGWADVATKHDLLTLEGRFDARFESLETRFDTKLDAVESKVIGAMDRGFRDQTWRLVTVLIAGIGAMLGVLVAAARF